MFYNDMNEDDNNDVDYNKIENNVLFVLRLIEMKGFFVNGKRLEQETKIALLDIVPDRELCYEIIAQICDGDEIGNELYFEILRDLDNYCEQYENLFQATE